LKIVTTRFGEVEIDESRIINMPDGIPGFDECKKFFIFGSEEQPIKWFQSVDKPEVALPIVNPFLFAKDYEVELSDDDVEFLKAEKPEDIAVFVVLVIPSGDPMAMTANLKAPIVINTKEKIGRQVVLMDDRYPIRYRVFGKDEKPASSSGGGM